MTSLQPVYEIRPRADRRGFELISDALPFGSLWSAEPNAASSAINYATFFSRSHDAVIRVYDEAGSVIETREHAGDRKWSALSPTGFDARALPTRPARIVCS